MSNPRQGLAAKGLVPSAKWPVSFAQGETSRKVSRRLERGGKGSSSEVGRKAPTFYSKPLLRTYASLVFISGPDQRRRDFLRDALGVWSMGLMRRRQRPHATAATLATQGRAEVISWRRGRL